METANNIIKMTYFVGRRILESPYNLWQYSRTSAIRYENRKEFPLLCFTLLQDRLEGFAKRPCKPGQFTAKIGHVFW